MRLVSSSQHVAWIGLGDLIFGPLVVLVSVFFLRRHNWARRGLQLTAVFLCAASAVWGMDFLRLIATSGGPTPSPSGLALRYVLLAVASCAIVIMWAPIVFSAWWLGRPAVAAEFRRREPAS